MILLENYFIYLATSKVYKVNYCNSLLLTSSFFFFFKYSSKDEQTYLKREKNNFLLQKKIYRVGYKENINFQNIV